MRLTNAPTPRPRSRRMMVPDGTTGTSLAPAAAVSLEEQGVGHQTGSYGSTAPRQVTPRSPVRARGMLHSLETPCHRVSCRS